MNNKPSLRLDYILEANLICSNCLAKQNFTYQQIEVIVKTLKEFLPYYRIPDEFNLVQIANIKKHLDHILEE